MVHLSIIIPHFNATHSLADLLDSIPAREEIEIIVVDDQSNENAKAELLALQAENAHRNIYFYENDGKKSAGTCRNIGMRKAAGEWILFADADDFFMEGFYQTVREYFSSDNDIVFFTPTSRETETGNISDRHTAFKKFIEDYRTKKSTQSELLLRYSFSVPWSKLMKTEFLKTNNIHFDELIASNDLMFSAKAGHYMKEFETSTQVIYCVTRSKGSLTVNTSENVFDARLTAHIDYCIFLREKLRKEDLKYFDIRGAGYLVNVIKYRLGLFKVLSTYTKLHKAKIKILDGNFLHPQYLSKKIANTYKTHKKDKKYYLR